MHPPVVTKDPTAVEVEVQSAYLGVYPGGDRGFVRRVFGWATDFFNGGYRDYLPVDVPYHNFEHTLQGTLCLARLWQGRHRAGAQPPLAQATFELSILAILMHDSGYLRKRSDTEGTGAKYTITHVNRSVAFASELLADKGFGAANITAVQNMILCTGLQPALNAIPFQSEQENIAGRALATADLLGQMAADDYVDRLPALYTEFAEAARHAQEKTHLVCSYSSAEDLMRGTPGFWEDTLRVKLNQDFDGLYRFLNDPYPGGPNEYLRRVEANIETLRRRTEMSVRT